MLTLLSFLWFQNKTYSPYLQVGGTTGKLAYVHGSHRKLCGENWICEHLNPAGQRLTRHCCPTGPGVTNAM